MKTVSKLEVKILIILDELSENYKTWEKQWFINNNLGKTINEDKKRLSKLTAQRENWTFRGNIEFIRFIITKNI